MVYSATPTMDAASAPNACDNAVRCGMAVIGTMAMGMPMAEPTTNPIAIHWYSTIFGSNPSVPEQSGLRPEAKCLQSNIADGSLFLLRFDRLFLAEHLRHAVRDQEAAGHVNHGGGHSHAAQNGAQLVRVLARNHQRAN